MPLAGKIDLTGPNAWTHGSRLKLTFTDSATTFDFPGKNDVRLQLFAGLGQTAIFTIVASDTNSMTRATGLLTIILDSSITSLPDLSTLWTTILKNQKIMVFLDYQDNAGEDYVPFASGDIEFDYPGVVGSNATSAFTFTHNATGTAFTFTLSTVSASLGVQANNTLYGNISGATAVPGVLTANQGQTILDTATDPYAKLGTAQEFTKTQNFNATSLTSTTNSIAWDAESNQVFKHTATENTTLANPTNLKDGATYIFIYTQHASAAKTLAFGSVFKWAGGTAPTVTTGASAVDVMTFISDGTNLYGSVLQNFS